MAETVPPSAFRLPPFWSQSGFDVRFEWGIDGVRALAPLSDIVIIVDVLSFTTCVEIAVTRGATVYPYRWNDAGEAAYAERRGALLAVKRNRVTNDHPYSLSPSSLEAIPSGTGIVLPSPNGSTCAFEAAELGATVIAGCLRNAEAVARGARDQGPGVRGQGSGVGELATFNVQHSTAIQASAFRDQPSRRPIVSVIAAGERWGATRDSEALRPAFEDLIGAGAILAALGGSPSPEARAAIAAFRAAESDLPALLAECASGRELLEMGYPDDVRLAAELNVSDAVPVLVDGGFVDNALLDLPIHDLGPWPEGLSLRREDLYSDDGR